MPSHLVPAITPSICHSLTLSASASQSARCYICCHCKPMSSIFQPHVPKSERKQNKYFEEWFFFLQKCVLFKFLFVSVSSRRAWLTTTAAEADVSGGETSHRDNNVPGTLTRIRDQGPRTRDQGPGTKDQGPRTKDQGPGTSARTRTRTRTRDQGPGTKDQYQDRGQQIARDICQDQDQD